MVQNQFIIFADVHINPAVIEQLRQRGVQVETVVDLLGQDAQDPDILEYAFEHGYTLLTHDKRMKDHVVDRYNANKIHYGVLIVGDHLQGTPGIGRIINEVLFIHEAIEANAATVEEDVYNQVKWIN